MGEVAALFALALASTIACELPLAALLFGVRDRRSVCVVVLAQVATNPLVELVCLTVGWDPGLPLTSFEWACMLCAEAAATVAEALIYRGARVSGHPWVMSLTLNACSFACGLVACAVGA